MQFQSPPPLMDNMLAPVQPVMDWITLFEVLFLLVPLPLAVALFAWRHRNRPRSLETRAERREFERFRRDQIEEWKLLAIVVLLALFFVGLWRLV